MFIRLFNIGLAAASVCLTGTVLPAADDSQAQANAERLAAMEQRIQELEARLGVAEQETKEVKVLASTGGEDPGVLGSASFDILANSAWRNLRWTRAEQWDDIRNGISEEKVIELLGSPPRSVKSLKPRVDKVFFYETSLRDASNKLVGRVSFKDGKVIAFQKPNFQ